MGSSQRNETAFLVASAVALTILVAVFAAASPPGDGASGVAAQGDADPASGTSSTAAAPEQGNVAVGAAQRREVAEDAPGDQQVTDRADSASGAVSQRGDSDASSRPVAAGAHDQQAFSDVPGLVESPAGRPSAVSSPPHSDCPTPSAAGPPNAPAASGCEVPATTSNEAGESRAAGSQNDPASPDASLRIPCPLPDERVLEQFAANEISIEEVSVLLLYRSLTEHPEKPLPDLASDSSGYFTTIDALRIIEDRVRRPHELERLEAGVESFPTLDHVPVRGRVTSRFGPRIHPVTGIPGKHYGVDLATSAGTAVGAALDGEVISVQPCDIYGNMVVLHHGSGIATLYAHLRTMEVAFGDRVEAADVLGTVGATGLATGPHLHFEARIDGIALDPLPLVEAALETERLAELEAEQAAAADAAGEAAPETEPGAEPKS